MPITTEVLQNQSYSSQLAAVEAAGRQFLGDSIENDVEHVGAILQKPDGSLLLTQGRSQPGIDGVVFTVRRPTSTTIVGYWHTHGAPGSQREYFSAADAKTVAKSGLPFYLITPKGQIKVLRPAAHSVRTVQRRSPGRARGEALAQLTLS